MKFILGKKLNMTQIWENDRVVAVTPIAAGPCVVTQLREEKKDGYQAVQVGFDLRKRKNIRKPQIGHLAKSTPSFAPDNQAIRNLKEFRVTDLGSVAVGDFILASTFAKGDIVKVTGTSKGKGFQGVVKRHHFQGGRKTHGNKDQLRMPGSIGPKGPAHVFKGTRMAGHMGNERVTVTNLEIIAVDEEKNLLYVKGAVPGCVSSLLMISGKGELITVKDLPKAPEDVVVLESNQEAENDIPEIVEETAAEENVESAPATEAELAPEEKPVQ